MNITVQLISLGVSVVASAVTAYVTTLKHIYKVETDVKVNEREIAHLKELCNKNEKQYNDIMEKLNEIMVKLEQKQDKKYEK